MTGEWEDVLLVYNGEFVGQLKSLRCRGTTGELATMFTLTGCSPWLLLTGSGANQGLGLSSQLGPVVFRLGGGNIQARGSQVQLSNGGAPIY